ncbi:MAG: hypothetical protein II921_10265 [Treponema sp.]|nr:hypothetical protein [Treponema sp.]
MVWGLPIEWILNTERITFPGWRAAASVGFVLGLGVCCPLGLGRGASTTLRPSGGWWAQSTKRRSASLRRN